MRYALLVILGALAVLLVLHVGKGEKANPVAEAGAALDKTQAAILPSQLQQVEAALDAFADERSAYPNGLDELIPDFLPRPDLLIDPWGTELRLERDGEGRSVLICAGPDRAFASSDDIRRSL